MPAILDRLVKQLVAKGHRKSSAYAIATKSLQKAGNLKKGTRLLVNELRIEHLKKVVNPQVNISIILKLIKLH